MFGCGSVRNGGLLARAYRGKVDKGTNVIDDDGNEVVVLGLVAGPEAAVGAIADGEVKGGAVDLIGGEVAIEVIAAGEGLAAPAPGTVKRQQRYTVHL